MTVKYTRVNLSEGTALLTEESHCLSKAPEIPKNFVKEKIKDWRAEWLWKEFSILAVVLLIQGGAVCADSFLYPFFPEEARKRGLDSD
ncbi:hypothetical protein EB796_019723 [Bugula neritina]|uniref:Uncharacterized protein n=1 Tax=Bugula neritina TaxID=10212 RepID=A0A7J7J8A7_BUGNE|nr:hypothetical protein EB796_019723 [Bugula neritina]